MKDFRLSHVFHETCRSVTFYFMKRDSKQCCDTATPESIHTKVWCELTSTMKVLYKRNDKFHGIHDLHCKNLHSDENCGMTFHQ